MPRLFINHRQRRFVPFLCSKRTTSAAATSFDDEGREQEMETERNQRVVQMLIRLGKYETSILYCIGGVLLVAGSVCFLPSVEDRYASAGSFLFVAASALYLYVSLHDIAEVFGHVFNSNCHDTFQNITKSDADINDTSNNRSNSNDDSGIEQTIARSGQDHATNKVSPSLRQEVFASTSYTLGAVLFIGTLDG